MIEEVGEQADPLISTVKPRTQLIEPRALRQQNSKMGRKRSDAGLLDNLRQYPPAVFFMLGNEFCERFSFYGMKAILMLYFITEHHMSESNATLIYHAFTCLAYLSPLLGSVMADSYFGKFKVILYVSVVYVFGHAVMSVGAIPSLDYNIRFVFDFAGLIIIAMATGGIKPCVSAFAADQFSSSQDHLRAQFFSFFYFAINAGSLFAIMLTPILRGRIKCFGSDYCFPLAFGVPGVLMLVALILFLFGWRFYKKNPPSRENIVGQVVKCIGTATTRNVQNKIKKSPKAPGAPASDWLDLAAPESSPQLISGVRSMLGVATIFAPLVFFWALFDQQGSTWVLQARRLDGRLGPITVLPEQINILNPLLILVMVPIFEGIVYPILRKTVEVTPLRKMAVGGLLTALSFAIAGLLQLEVNKTMEVAPAEGRVYLQRIGNASIVTGFMDHQGNNIAGGHLPVGRTEIDAGMYTIMAGSEKFELDLSAPGKGYVVGLFEKESNSSISIFHYDTEKVQNGGTRIYLVVPKAHLEGGQLFAIDYKNRTIASTTLQSGNHITIHPTLISSPDYQLYYGNGCSGVDCPHHVNFFAQMGSSHVLHVKEGAGKEDVIQLVRPNSLNIAWMLPQYIIITLGEVLLSVTGLEFAYSQSSPEMKSVLQAMWLLTTFLGNAIDMAISGAHLIAEPAAEFFAYAALMLLVMMVFILIATRYKYVDEQPEEAAELEKKERIPTEDTTC